LILYTKQGYEEEIIQIAKNMAQQKQTYKRSSNNSALLIGVAVWKRADVEAVRDAPNISAT
jgi:hypothetical protein